MVSFDVVCRFIVSYDAVCRFMVSCDVVCRLWAVVIWYVGLWSSMWHVDLWSAMMQCVDYGQP